LPGPVASTEDPLLTDERWQLALRVGESPQFQKSPRLKKFLLYVCERKLQNQLEDVHEQVIGCEVFGRRHDYSSSEDNIVRVEARNLRRRLESYFAEDGASEPVVIVIPKGTYVPNFEPRPIATPPEQERSPQNNTFTGGQPSKRKPSYWVVVAVISFLIPATILYLSRQRSIPRIPAESKTQSPLEQLPVLAEMFDNNHETVIVVADSCLSVLNDLLGRQISLAEYIKSGYPSNVIPAGVQDSKTALMQLISSRYYTSLADIQTVPKILLASPEFANRTSVSYARDSQIRAFKTANVILLGSRRANPWSELFEPQLNFVPEWENHSIRFRNKSPLPGESSEYVVRSRSGTYTYTSSYSVIAFLPNLEHNGNVLLLGGGVMEGTEASGDLLTNPVLSSRLVHDLALKDGHGHLKYFEVLFRNVIIGGIAKNPEIVAYRILQD
jgi:hypothetical protein